MARKVEVIERPQSLTAFEAWYHRYLLLTVGAVAPVRIVTK